MPRSLHLDESVEALLREYRDAFPSSLFRGPYTLLTHITPGGRLKKLVFAFPSASSAGRTYSGLPVVHALALGDKRSQTVRLWVTDLASLPGPHTHREVTMATSDASAAVNRRVLDRVVRELRRALWRVGPARPDHFSE